MADIAALNETHDPSLACWVESAHEPQGDFPIQNLPFGVFKRRGSLEAWRGGVAIGDQVVDLAAAHAAGLFSGEAARAAAAACAPTLNAMMALGPQANAALRLAISRGLRPDARQLGKWRNMLIPQSQVELALPMAVGDYTDFYTSLHHATNVGRLFRPDDPLLPNYKWVPIGYHGRASSIGVSGTDFHRPCGQTRAPDASEPVLGACRRLDYELELGIVVGTGNPQGDPIALDDAEAHVFGLCLLNDWSARDIQAWEYQPLGPFLSKSFATTISPWIVTLEALAPYRVAFERPAGDPQPLPYLDGAANRAGGALDVRVQARIETQAMKAAGVGAHVLSESSYRHAYWTIAQLVAHHSVNGCNLAPGDLFGSGTLSGPTPAEAGALIELTMGGRNPIELPGGERRSFLEDGDTVSLYAWCERPGAARIGFGTATATVLPAKRVA
ncbi:MAG: fumarylacetoacetase [Lautropia sp.]